MVLVDTSIWIDYLNRGDNTLEKLLLAEAVVMHRHVLGEIALGSIKNRQEQLAVLHDLRQIPVSSDAEVMAMIEWEKLYATGIGFVDAHLLASVKAAGPDYELLLWTRDKSLSTQAKRLGVAADL